VDVAKQLDDRDAAHKAEVEQLKGRVAELLKEKEQREGQLKKAQELLVTSEADASNAHAELNGLKEQATKWEVDIARLNVDLASKPQILFYPTYLVRYIFSGILLCRHIFFLLTFLPSFRPISCFRRRR
jgi:hypothetical protein